MGKLGVSITYGEGNEHTGFFNRKIYIKEARFKYSRSEFDKSK
ncbi:MAG: hypothetical protein CM15mP83_2550 [Flavobacteriaceae bacterium]|nr:MAG: hypothetical protein CM15mP83_2550 [Flavobacteriaceae bacterium]